MVDAYIHFCTLAGSVYLGAMKNARKLAGIFWSNKTVRMQSAISLPDVTHLQNRHRLKTRHQHQR